MNTNETKRFFCNTIAISDNTNLNLIQIGWDKCEAGYTYSHSRDIYIIHFVKSGKGMLDTNGQQFILSEGSAFIIRPNVLTVLTADTDNPWELCFFAFNGEYADTIVEKTVFKNGTISAFIDNNSIWQDIVKIALDSDGTKSFFKSSEYLYKLLSFFEFGEYAQPVFPESIGTYQKYISEVQNYIQQNYSKSIKISDLASMLNVSRSHLYRIFKKHTGKSIENYLVTVRINAARSLLEDTEFSAISISSFVGYSHYSTFHKMFKLYTGQTPQEYRESIQKSTKNSR